MRYALTWARYSPVSKKPLAAKRLARQMRLWDQTFNQGNYYEDSHYRPIAGRKIMRLIYAGDSTNTVLVRGPDKKPIGD